jgi:hypothetical protein
LIVAGGIAAIDLAIAIGAGSIGAMAAFNHVRSRRCRRGGRVVLRRSRARQCQQGKAKGYFFHFNDDHLHVLDAEFIMSNISLFKPIAVCACWKKRPMPFLNWVTPTRRCK